MWTARVGAGPCGSCPPGKLLPDRQPAYVASWIYVFGVATLAALGRGHRLGLAIALGGPDWWHTNPVGHFFNSLHLWSVERSWPSWSSICGASSGWPPGGAAGRLTWITGVVAFVASVVECFTGYLSQQNFDSQWISTNGKDAFNAVGLGAFFNLMNFGQMLLWHVVLIPSSWWPSSAPTSWLVRVRGVVHPLPVAGTGAGPRGARRGGRRRGRLARARPGATTSSRRPPSPSWSPWSWSSPWPLCCPPRTSRRSPCASGPGRPGRLLATAATELAGTSETASYGPPYNSRTANAQRICSPQTHRRCTPADRRGADLRAGPLAKVAPTDPALAAALRVYRAAPPPSSALGQRVLKAVTKVTFSQRHGPVVPAAKTARCRSCWPPS